MVLSTEIQVNSQKNVLKEVTSDNPCIHCGKHDYCYTLGELNCCKRGAEPAPGWRITKKCDKDQTPFYAPIDGAKQNSPKIISHRKRDPKPLAIPSEARIVLLPEQVQDIPKPQKPQFIPKRIQEQIQKTEALASKPREIDRGGGLVEFVEQPAVSLLPTVTEKIYEYSESQWVHRYQWDNPTSEKGYSKSFVQRHVASDGQILYKKGDQHWKAYRLDEAIAQAKLSTSPALLQQEGEDCVDIARNGGISSFTFQGSNWSQPALLPEYQRIKKEVGEVLIVFLHDPDDAGLKKVKICQECAALAGLPFLAIDPNAICSNLPYEKSDIKEIFELMDVAQFIQKLEAEIHAAVQARHNQPDEPELSVRDQDNQNNQNNQKNQNNKQNQQLPCTDHPERQYSNVCRWLKLNFDYCVTNQTFDGWVYRYHFGGENNEWIVLNSAFYKWSQKDQTWKHQLDSRVDRFVADAGEKAFKLFYNKEFGWHCKFPYETNHAKESAFKYARSKLNRDGEVTDITHLLGFRNCVVDTRTGEKLPHNKEYYLRQQIPCDYEPNQPCPEVFRNFVTESFGEDMLEIIRAFTAMFLDPTAPYGRFPHLIGQSGGGKGTLGRFWSSLFGDDGSATASHFSDISTPEGRHQYLTSKRIFGFPDIGGYAQGVRSFYELVDNGAMSGRALYNPVAYNTKWFVRFWVASVDHLQIENAGDGWSRRAYPLPVLSRKVSTDPTLWQKLESTKAEVISWALAMPKADRDRILLQPPTNERVLQVKRDADIYKDSVKAYVDQCLRPSLKGVHVPNYLLYDCYKAYCKKSGNEACSEAKFISHLKTVIPRNHVPRSWTPMKEGKRQQISAHWSNLDFIPEAFTGFIRNVGETHQIEITNIHPNADWTCQKAHCRDGGLDEFQAFWDGTHPILSNSKTKEPNHSKPGQGVPLIINPQNDPALCVTSQNQGCADCSTGSGSNSNMSNMLEKNSQPDQNFSQQNLFSGDKLPLINEHTLHTPATTSVQPHSSYEPNTEPPAPPPEPALTSLASQDVVVVDETEPQFSTQKGIVKTPHQYFCQVEIDGVPHKIRTTDLLIDLEQSVYQNHDQEDYLKSFSLRLTETGWELLALVVTFEWVCYLKSFVQAPSVDLPDTTGNDGGDNLDGLHGESSVSGVSKRPSTQAADQTPPKQKVSSESSMTTTSPTRPAPKIGDRVVYIGKNETYRSQYTGELTVTVLDHGMVTAQTSDGRLTTWLHFYDLRLINGSEKSP